MKGPGHLAILEALDNLNTLIEANSLDELEVTEDLHLVSHRGGKEKYWVQAGPDKHTQDAIRETYRTVLGYLQSFYHRMKDAHDQKRLITGVNTIMVLVGEATKKLQRFDTLFKQTVTEYKEFKDLQNFYRNKIIKETYKRFEKIPIPKLIEVPKEKTKMEGELQGLLEEEEPVEVKEGEHILNDLDVVKRDHLYELFYLRNEAGHFFYTTELGKQLKLACDFGEFAEAYFNGDPLLQIKNWEDRSLHLCAKEILKRHRPKVERFYRSTTAHKGFALVATMHKALMALMLAANPRNLIRQFAIKASSFYFHDFLLFLREALHDADFQKYLVYPVPGGKPFLQDTLTLVHALSATLFLLPRHHEELQTGLQGLVAKGLPKGGSLAERVAAAYKALQNVLQKHPSGPIFKALDLVREDDEERSFDPLFLGNYPEQETLFTSGDKEILCLRIPCPITQIVINRAEITEEFKNFLRNADKKILYLNFQDRTSWKEHARCLALEELGRQALFADVLTLVTMTKESHFYNQIGEYETLNDALAFRTQLKQHLFDESSGYTYPPFVKEKMSSDWLERLLLTLHSLFFENKKSLTFLEKITWIEIAYSLLILKLIELSQPDALALSSKDALDIGATSLVALIALLTQGQGKEWSEEEFQALQRLLFGPVLLQRERPLLPERIDRLCSMMRLLEEKGAYLEAFSSLYKKETLKLEIVLLRQ
jgi:hypothetical protein